MALFDKVEQLLESLSVVNIPATIDPGAVLSPGLTPAISAVYALVGDVELARVVSLLKATLDPPITAPTVQTILKHVQFTRPATAPVETTAAGLNPGEANIGPLPYIIPVAGTPVTLGVGQAVEGAIAKASVDNNTLVAFIRAALANLEVRIVQRVLDVPPTVKLTWQIVDGSEVELAAVEVSYDTNGVPSVVQRPGSDWLTSVADGLPKFVPLPEFVDYTGAEPPLVERYLRCDVVIDLRPAGPELKRRLGPIQFKLPRIPIPRALIVTEHVDFIGRAFVVLPSSSAARTVSDLLAPLTRVRDVLTTLTQTAAQLSIVLPADVEPVRTTLAVLDALARAASPPVVWTNWWNAEFVWYSARWLHPLTGMFIAVFPFSVHWWWPWPSALALIGPAGAKASAFVGDYFETRWGALTLTTGRWGAAVVSSVVGAAPAALPAGSTCTVDRAASSGNFNDSLKSFSFP